MPVTFTKLRHPKAVGSIFEQINSGKNILGLLHRADQGLLLLYGIHLLKANPHTHSSPFTTYYTLLCGKIKFSPTKVHMQATKLHYPSPHFSAFALFTNPTSRESAYYVV